MWVNTPNGINLFFEKTKQFEHFYFDKSSNVENATNIANAVFQDSKKKGYGSVVLPVFTG